VRQSGRVKWFNLNKGFGCILMDGGDEVAVQASAIQRDGLRTLEEGQAVAFDLAQGPHGPQAEKVIPIGEISE
jgi:CspA family cold shock protein